MDEEEFQSEVIPEDLDALFYGFFEPGVFFDNQTRIFVSIPPGHQTLSYYPGPAWEARGRPHKEYHVYVPWIHTVWVGWRGYLHTAYVHFAWTPLHVSDVGTQDLILNRQCLGDGAGGSVRSLRSAAEIAAMWSSFGINHDMGNGPTTWMRRLASRVTRNGISTNEAAFLGWEQKTPEELRQLHSLKNRGILSNDFRSRRECKRILDRMIHHPHNEKVLKRLDPAVLTA